MDMHMPLTWHRAFEMTNMLPWGLLVVSLGLSQRLCALNVWQEEVAY